MLFNCYFDPNDAAPDVPERSLNYGMGEAALSLFPISCTDKDIIFWRERKLRHADMSRVVPILPRATAGSGLFHLFL